MGGVVKAMESAMKSMNLEKVSAHKINMTAWTSHGLFVIFCQWETSTFFPFVYRSHSWWTGLSSSLKTWMSSHKWWRIQCLHRPHWQRLRVRWIVWCRRWLMRLGESSAVVVPTFIEHQVCHLKRNFPLYLTLTAASLADSFSYSCSCFSTSEILTAFCLHLVMTVQFNMPLFPYCWLSAWSWTWICLQLKQAPLLPPVRPRKNRYVGHRSAYAALCHKTSHKCTRKRVWICCFLWWSARSWTVLWLDCPMPTGCQGIEVSRLETVLSQS